MLAAGMPRTHASLEATLSEGRRARVPVHGSPLVGAAESSPGEVTESPESSRRHSGEPSWGQKRCLGSSWVESHCLIPSAQASSSLPSGGFIFSSPLPRGQGHGVVFLWQASLNFLLEMGRVVSAASWGVVKVRGSNPRESVSAGVLAVLSRAGIPGSRIPVIGFLIFPSDWALTD